MAIIGLTPDFQEAQENDQAQYFLHERCVTAVEEAGGIPVIVPYVTDQTAVASLLHGFDGLMLTGGAFDIDPFYYDEEWTVKPGTVKAGRTQFEMEITQQAMERDLPILGICGGEQMINVALKGSLYQDIVSQIESALDHEQKHNKSEPHHSVRVQAETLLHRIVGKENLEVNSTHHQSVREPGQGVIVNAVAEDGVIEGIESRAHRFVLGVQWHPEYLFETDPACRKIFEALVREAGRSHH